MSMRQMKKMKTIALLFFFILLSTFPAGASDEKVSKACTFKGIPLQGKVQIVNSFPDIKVQRVQSFPDLKVEWVKSFPDKCGKWERVESFPDFKIQYVESFPDLKIQSVTVFPGIHSI
jgi:hypothetical protein